MRIVGWGLGTEGRRGLRARLGGRGGHALLLVMLLGSALLISGAVLASRAHAGIRQQHADDVRLQALWLARSALLADVTGERTVETPLGAATVTVAGGTATVEIGGARATVQREPWVERFGAGE